MVKPYHYWYPWRDLWQLVQNYLQTRGELGKNSLNIKNLIKQEKIRFWKYHIQFWKYMQEKEYSQYQLN